MLTLMGRVLVVNTLVESLFVYKMCVIEILPDSMYNIFHQKILNFVWRGRRAKNQALSTHMPEISGWIYV